jgi:hypothetical protein
MTDKLRAKWEKSGFYLVDPKAPRPKLWPPLDTDLDGEDTDIRDWMIEEYGPDVIGEFKAMQVKRAEEMADNPADLTPEQERWMFKTLGWDEE